MSFLVSFFSYCSDPINLYYLTNEKWKMWISLIKALKKKVTKGCPVGCTPYLGQLVQKNTNALTSNNKIKHTLVSFTKRRHEHCFLEISFVFGTHSKDFRQRPSSIFSFCLFYIFVYIYYVVKVYICLSGLWMTIGVF